MEARKSIIGELIAEVIAVAIIILIGDSVAGMIVLYDPPINPYANAYWGVCITWGLAVTIAIYVTGSVSGCHANPAVTLSLAMFRDFPWKKVVPYWAAQIVGGFIGAAIVYALYVPVIDHFNAVHHFARDLDAGAAGMFFTSPGPFITPMHAFTDEIILTAFLVLGIFAITEQYNEAAPMANSGALIIGLLVAAIGASAGFLEAWAINPARDFGPRLFCFFAGWGTGAIPGKLNYFWVPIVAPLIGGPIGAAIYQFAVRPFLPKRAEAGMPQRISPDAVVPSADRAV